MDSTLLRPVTGEEIETFWRDGAVCLRGVIDPEWLDSLVEPIEALLEDPATVNINEIADAVRNADGSADRILEDPIADAQERGRYSVHTGSDVDAIRRFETESMVPEIAARILGSSFLDLHVDQILVKEPGSPTRTAFHIDESYFNVSGDKVCTVWVPFDTVTVESGAMGFVRGSHLWETAYLPNNFVSQAVPAHDGTDGRTKLPDIEGNPEQFDIVYYEVEPGDVTIHHYRTAHGSGGNTTRDRRRRALAIRYCGDDVRWQPGVSSGPGVRAFENSLKPGDPLDRAPDCFPRCWTAPAVV
jgi:ectoine hydroxylase-related dioxygenase (phytanoyl-CoA dioxygenase family)